MKNFLNRRLLAMVVATVLLAAMVWGATSCGKTEPSDEVTTTAAVTAEPSADNTVGEGQTAFTFEVTHLDGSTKTFTVKTDADTVGAALLEHELIAGEEGAYGLYVKTVNGMLADYDVDQTYWSFLIAGETAMTGVDQTEITEGTVYALVRTK